MSRRAEKVLDRLDTAAADRAKLRRLRRRFTVIYSTFNELATREYLSATEVYEFLRTPDGAFRGGRSATRPSWWDGWKNNDHDFHRRLTQWMLNANVGDTWSLGRAAIVRVRLRR